MAAPTAAMLALLTAPPERFSRAPSLFILVCIAITGTFPIHLFVPVMSDAAADLNVSVGAIQAAITGYLLGLSCGQLLVGPMSDRIGRRPVLILGLAIFVLGTLGVAFSFNLASLILSRVVQAVGGCAGLALGRAIARDTADTESATQRLAILAAAMSLGPGLAPLISTQLSGLAGWRGLFLLLALANALLLLATIMTLRETHVVRAATSFRSYFLQWVALLKNRHFLGHCIGGAFGTTNFYAVVANSPLVFCGVYGFSKSALGVLYLLFVGSLTAGNLFGSRLAGRVSSSRILLWVGFSMTSLPLILLYVDLTKPITSTAFIVGNVLVCISIGVCGPFALTASLSTDLKAIGAASGLYGCIQMVVGAAIVSGLGFLSVAATRGTLIVLTVSGAVAWLAFMLTGSPEPNRSKAAGLFS